MKITTENLHMAIAALRQCAKENEGRQTDTGAIRVTDLCTDVADYLERQLATADRTKASAGRYGHFEADPVTGKTVFVKPDK